MEKAADGFRNDSQFLSYSRLGLLQFHIAGHFLNTWAHNLQFNNLPKELIAYFQHAGAQYHPVGMAESIWGTIPHSIRMAGPDTVREFLHTRDWSHFIPHSHGGGHGAGHGIFESLMLNRSRGAHPMTHAEILHAREILHSAALKQVMQNALEVTLTAGLIAIAVTAVLSIMENGLRYKQGELDHKELYGRVFKETIRNAAASVAVSGIIIGLVLVFPLLMPVLSAVALPLAVVGFSLLGHRFYRLSAEWLKETDLTPAIEMWNTVAMETADAVLWVTHNPRHSGPHCSRSTSGRQIGTCHALGCGNRQDIGQSGRRGCRACGRACDPRGKRLGILDNEGIKIAWQLDHGQNGRKRRDRAHGGKP